MKTNAFLRGFIFYSIAIALVAGLSPLRAEAGAKRIIELKDPNSGDSLSIDAPISSMAAFEADKPSRLFAQGDQMRQEMIKNCRENKVGIFKSVSHSFVPESIGFASALALMGQMEAHGDPAAIKHWHEQSVMDPLAHVSFGMFMVGNRAAGEFMNMMSLTFDPCTAVKRLKPGAPLVFSESRMQKMFRPIAGGMAMSTGFILSSAVHEILADPNIRQCANLMLGRVAKADVAKARRACDYAHADWAPGAKFSDYLDDVLANITFVCFQGYGVEAAKQLISKGVSAAEPLAKRGMLMGYSLKRGATRLVQKPAGVVMRFAVTQGVKTIAFRGATVVLTVGKFIGVPVVRAAIWIGNMIIFLKGLDFIMPYFTKPWEQYSTGNDLTRGISEILAELNKAERNGWAWTPPARPISCDPKVQQAMAMGTPDGNYVVPKECYTTPKTPGELVDLMNYKQKKWRDFIMADAKTETGNWQDFVLQFTNTYSASYKIYMHFVSSIAGNEFLTKRGIVDPRPNFLYFRPKFWNFALDEELSVGAEGGWDGKICHLPRHRQDQLAEARKVIDDELASKTSWLKRFVMPDTWLGPDFTKGRGLFHNQEEAAAQDNLNVIRAGLVAMDCRLPLPMAPDYKSTRGVTPEQIEALRYKRWTEAVKRLFFVLSVEPQRNQARWVDIGRDVDHELYPWFARVNPYMKINMILGDPEPYPVGSMYVRLLNGDDTMIDQDRKGDHPRKVGQIATPKMTEYITANMVCGPEASRPGQILITGAWGKTKDFVARQWNRLRGITPWSRPSPDAPPSRRMIEIVHNWKAEFIPPKIIDDKGSDICNNKPYRGNLMMDAGSLPTVDYKYDPHLNWFKVGNSQFQGLINVVKWNLRPEILGRKNNDPMGFPRWWASNVEPLVRTTLEDFRAQYKRIILEKYVPAIVKADRAVYNGRSFALGARNSIIDEFKLNMAILKRVHNAGRDPKTKDSGYDLIMPILSNVQRRFENGLKYVGTTDELRNALIEEAKIPVRMEGQSYYTDSKQPVTYTSRVAIESFARNHQQIEVGFQLLEGLLKAPGQRLTPAGQRTVAELREAAVTNLKNLVTELDSWNGILISLRVEGQQ